MQDLPVTLMSILHPGDLGLGGLLILLIVFTFLMVVPVLLVVLIIYKIARRKSRRL